MAYYQDKFVITAPARVIWDGITDPEKLENGGYKYTMKVAMLASATEMGELEHIATQAIQGYPKFNGTLPNGGIWPLNDVREGEFGDMLAGHKVFNTSTYRQPEVYDEHGAKLQQMQFANMFYAGSTVQLVVCAKTFDNRSRGVKFELHGVRVVDATSEKIPVSAGIDVAAAFGASPQAPQAPAPQAPQAPAPQAPPAPAMDFLLPDGKRYSRDQLIASGWSEDQIAGLSQ